MVGGAIYSNILDEKKNQIMVMNDNFFLMYLVLHAW